jgi:hypothetical protein
MRSLITLCGVAELTLCALATTGQSTSAQGQTPKPDKDGFISLFDGKTLDGWRASDKPGTFSVENGAIVVNGPRSHLYYVGPVGNHNFKNFEWKADVMTTKGSNSGMYFHTEWQETGWPAKGFPHRMAGNRLARQGLRSSGQQLAHRHDPYEQSL